ncbi:DNA mismatch repair protein MLH1 [Nematocida homosporus]|uniref:DNA mismatch repair protein MLH1 n=1 Tax=Nematocida homosporus TaxID=1912981 RepID=UPI002220247D|nr:DNA mismatch repair protein MLH1 [Nematocida homosporus]KAI5185005.1 DNA mismatch repair protein MLH1 [Nematocida homosporus]
MTIQALPSEVIAKIAAGEVVLSPAAGIKELIENSLDAKASFIRISLTDKLVDKIEIEDNGTGIALADAPLLCRRHATSKLSSYKDLESVGTLGFRGEALASISSLAQVSVQTSVGVGLGHLLVYDNTRLVSQKEVSCLPGTKLMITDLFFNDPIKRDQFAYNKQEIKKIYSLVMRYSICYQQVVFEIELGLNRQRYNQPLPTTKIAAIAQVFSYKLKNGLIPFETTQAEIRIIGAFTHANFVLNSLVFILFVNQRLVELPKLKRALVSLYKEVLVKGHPFVYIEIDVPPAQIDVNVHPSKTEVHLSQEDSLIDTILVQIKNTLQNQKLTGQSKSTSIQSEKENITPSKSQSKHLMSSQLLNSNSSIQSPNSNSKSTPSQLNPTTTQLTPNPSQHDSRPLPSTPSKKIRTDSQILPLNLFLSPKRPKLPSTPQPTATPSTPTPTHSNTNPIHSNTNPIHSNTNPIQTTTIFTVDSHPMIPLSSPGQYPPATLQPLQTTQLPSTSQISCSSSTCTPATHSLKGALLVGPISSEWMLFQKEANLLAFNIYTATLSYLMINLPNSSNVIPLSLPIPATLIPILTQPENTDLLFKNKITLQNHFITTLPFPPTNPSNTTPDLATLFSPTDFLPFLQALPTPLLTSHLTNPFFLICSALTTYLIQTHPTHLFRILQQSPPTPIPTICISSVPTLYQLFNR